VVCHLTQYVHTIQHSHSTWCYIVWYFRLYHQHWLNLYFWMLAWVGLSLPNKRHRLVLSCDCVEAQRRMPCPTHMHPTSTHLCYPFLPCQSRHPIVYAPNALSNTCARYPNDHPRRLCPATPHILLHPNRLFNSTHHP